MVRGDEERREAHTGLDESKYNYQIIVNYSLSGIISSSLSRKNRLSNARPLRLLCSFRERTVSTLEVETC